jgi:hypothetical protein
MKINVKAALPTAHVDYEAVNEILLSISIDGMKAFDAHVKEMILAGFKATGSYPNEGEDVFIGISRYPGKQSLPVYWRVVEISTRFKKDEPIITYWGSVNLNPKARLQEGDSLFVASQWHKASK